MPAIDEDKIWDILSPFLHKRLNVKNAEKIINDLLVMLGLKKQLNTRKRTAFIKRADESGYSANTVEVEASPYGKGRENKDAARKNIIISRPPDNE